MATSLHHQLQAARAVAASHAAAM
eukprot:SAG31_NODE_39155_length_290_cov_1.083770_1_plen_23_part_10